MLLQYDVVLCLDFLRRLDPLHHLIPCFFRCSILAPLFACTRRLRTLTLPSSFVSCKRLCPCFAAFLCPAAVVPRWTTAPPPPPVVPTRRHESVLRNHTRCTLLDFAKMARGRQSLDFEQGHQEKINQLTVLPVSHVVLADPIQWTRQSVFLPRTAQHRLPGPKPALCHTDPRFADSHRTSPTTSRPDPHIQAVHQSTSTALPPCHSMSLYPLHLLLPSIFASPIGRTRRQFIPILSPFPIVLPLLHPFFFSRLILSGSGSSTRQFFHSSPKSGERAPSIPSSKSNSTFPFHHMSPCHEPLPLPPWHGSNSHHNHV